MDKRSILYLACVFLSFFAIQTYFDKTPPSQEALPPTVTLFADDQGKKQISYAVSYGDLLFTMSTQETLPEVAYISARGAFQPVFLASPTHANDPALYSRQKRAMPASLPSFAGSSATSIHLVSPSNPQSSLAQKSDQNWVATTSLSERAIALIKINDIYLPVGVYDPEKQNVKVWQEYETLRLLAKSAESTPNGAKEEIFYILETDTQQLVFSTLGGSLAEINLPIGSLVKEIDIDRLILANSPQNSRFPLHPYYTIDENGKRAFRNEGSLGGYYPLLRRDILGVDGTLQSAVPPQYYAAVLSGTENTAFSVTRFEKNLIQFEGSRNGQKIRKTYSIPSERNGPYCFELSIEIDGSGEPIWISSGLPDVELLAGSYSPLLKYQATVANQLEVEELSLPKQDSATMISNVAPNWISNCNGFFGLIFDPLTPTNIPGFHATQIDGTVVPTRLTLVDPPYTLYPANKYPAYAISLPLPSHSTVLLRIFAGPYDETLLGKLDKLYDDPVHNYHPEYAQAQSIQGWFSFISQPFAELLSLLMQIFYTITHSWVLSILLLTIALKAMMYPLNAWSIRSTARMQEFTPKIKAIQERYKKDTRRMQEEIMAFYKEKGLSPFSAAAGCLPMLLQLPFLMGMFYLLKSSFPLRGAMFIPGWIDDLAAPDTLFRWKQPLWIVGNEFHLLPFLLGVVMLLQQKFTTTSSAAPTDAERQQKAMGTMMAVVFTAMFYSFPSGLNLYFMFSTLLGILQQWYMTKRKEQCKPGSSS